MSIRKSFLVFVAMYMVLVFSGTAYSETVTGSAVEVSVAKYEPYPAEPARYVDIWLQIQNTGLRDANDFFIEFSQNFPFSIESGESSSVVVGTIPAAGTIIKKFRFLVDANAPTGTAELTLRYGTGTVMIEKTLEIEVRAKDALLSITSTSTEPKIISAGSDAKIFIGLENLAETLFQNVVVKLDFLGTAFTPIDSASEKRISAIAAGGSSTFFYDIISDPSTESGVYQIPITITYSDTAGNNYTKSGIIGIVVDTPPSLDLNIETKDPILSNKAQDLIFSISNTGPSNVKFLTVHILQDNSYSIIGRAKEYLGNLDPDDFETAEFTIYTSRPSASGQQDFKIKLEYRDAFNNEVQETRTLSVPLYTESELAEFGLGSNGSSSNTTIAVVVVIALAYYLYRRRKKRKA